MLKFSIGDLVVVPGCGVGVVEDIEMMTLDKDPVEMYRIYVEPSKMRMWVPTGMAVAQRVRLPIQAEAIDEILHAIRETTAPEKRLNWNRRQRRYNEQLMSNDPMDMAQLLGELASVRGVKTLSFGERKLYDRARELLESEFKVASDCSDICERFEAALAA